ncbi:MAG: HD domain-containing protein [Euryarchaeota archaeon]
MREWMKLKSVKREGWVRSGVDDPESVAAHSWGMAILAMHLCPDNLNKMRVLEMCLVHDLPEIIVGDLTPHDDTTTKHNDEISAMKILAPQWLGHFEEYEDNSTEEAKFVKYLDKLDMALMARFYEGQQDLDLQEFIDSAKKVIGETNLN